MFVNAYHILPKITRLVIGTTVRGHSLFFSAWWRWHVVMEKRKWHFYSKIHQFHSEAFRFASIRSSLLCQTSPVPYQMEMILRCFSIETPWDYSSFLSILLPRVLLQCYIAHNRIGRIRIALSQHLHLIHAKIMSLRGWELSMQILCVLLKDNGGLGKRA